MANATDFIATVYDTIANTFNMGGGAPPNLFMQMAWPGIPINEDDCKDASGHYDPAIAEELFSSLSNIAPAMSKLKFENSGFYLDDLYEIILSCARPNGVAEADLDVNPMYKLFANAQYEFAMSERGSIRDAFEFYHPCKATPSNWYDEKASSSWTNIKIEANQIKPFNAQDLNSPFVKFNGIKLLESGIMKIKNANVIDTPLNTRLVNINLNKKVALESKFKKGSFTTTPSIVHKNFEKVFKAMHITKVEQQSVVLNNSFKVRLENVNTKNKIKRPIPYNSFVKNEKVLSTIKSHDIYTNKLMVKPKVFSAKNSIFLNDMLIKDLPTKQSVGTDGFSISFKFCRVNIDRPWLNLTLLSTPNWYIYGASKGEYSTGSAENNPGMFPLITTSFILISNLCIEANWSVTDKDNLANAVSFGPFDLRNSTINRNKIEVKGMQLIGCFSKLTTILAPNNAPNC